MAELTPQTVQSMLAVLRHPSVVQVLQQPDFVRAALTPADELTVPLRTALWRAKPVTQNAALMQTIAQLHSQLRIGPDEE